MAISGVADVPSFATPRQREIIQIAAEVFDEKGYRAASIQDIAERAGILKGSLYHYIGSKEELITDVVAEAISSMREELVPPLADSTVEPEERIREFLRREISTASDQGSQIGTIVRNFRELPPAPYEDWRTLRAEMVAGIAAVLEEGLKRGQFAPIQHIGVAANVILSAGSPQTALLYRETYPHLIAANLAALVAEGMASPERSDALRFPTLVPGASEPHDGIEARVLGAASEVMHRHGYHGATMREIASAAGLTKARVFRIFGSKEGLYERIVTRMYNDSFEFVRPAFELEAPAWTRLLAFISLHVRFCIVQAVAIPVMQQELSQLSTEVEAQRVRMRARYMDRVDDLLAAAQAEGSIRRDIAPPQARRALMQMGSTIWDWYPPLANEGVSPSLMVEVLGRMYLYGLRPRP